MKVRLLNQRRPGRERTPLLRALFEGGPLWHDLRSTWFRRRPAEPEDVYLERLSLLTYTNHVGGVLGTLVALLFSEAPVVEGLGAGDGAGDFYSRLLEDVDGAGTPWAELWPTIVEDALVDGAGWLWMDLPARAEGQTFGSLGEQLRAGALDATLHRVAPEQVLDWGEGRAGALTWVLFVSENADRAGPDQERTRTWTWTYIDGERVRRWRWTARADKPVPTAEDVAEELPEVLHGLGQLPVVRLLLPANLWAMHRLEDPAVKLCRSENELAWALHQAAHELLVMTSKSDVEAPVLGHGHYLQVQRDKDGEDGVRYVAPTGVAFEHLREERDADRADLFRAFQTMAQALDPQRSQPASGASKDADWRGAEVILSALAVRVLGAMRRALELVIAARGERWSPTVTGLDGWHVEDLETFLRAGTMAVDAARLSPTFRRLLARRQAERVLGAQVRAEELAQVRAEIDASDDALGDDGGDLLGGALRR